MSCGVVGYKTRVAIDNGSAIQNLMFTGFSDQTIREVVDGASNGMTGLRWQLSDRVISGIRIVRMSLSIDPNVRELGFLLPLAGHAETPANTFKTSATVPAFTMHVDRGAKTHVYSNCKIDTFSLSMQRGSSPASLSMSIIGIDVTESSAGTWPAGAADFLAGAPVAFSYGQLSIGGSARAFDRAVLTISNALSAQFNDSVTADCILDGQASVVFQTSVPYIAGNTALLTSPLTTDSYAGVTGATLTLNAGLTPRSVITLNHIFPVSQLPDILGKNSEVRLPLFYEVRGNSTEGPVSVTNTLA